VFIKNCPSRGRLTSGEADLHLVNQSTKNNRQRRNKQGQLEELSQMGLYNETVVWRVGCVGTTQEKQ